MSRKPIFVVIFLLVWLLWPLAGGAQSQLNISHEFASKKVDSPKYLDDLCGDLKITGGTGWLFIEVTVSPYKKGNFKIYTGVQTFDGLYIDCGPYYLPDIRLDDSRSRNEQEPKQSVDGQPLKWTRKVKIGRNLKPFTMKFCISGTYWDWKSMQLAQTVAIKAFWFEGENDPGNPLSTSPASADLKSLGKVWHTTEAGGWTGTWTRRGDTSVFDAVWINGSQRVTGVFTMTVEGLMIRFQSRKQSNGHDVDYAGLISADGRSARGTLKLLPSGSSVSWEATVVY
jgi:hypothetical protein